MEELDFDSLVDVDADLTAHNVHEVNVEVTEAVHTVASEKEDDEDDADEHHMPVSTT